MKDGFGSEIMVHDWVVYATLSGHKPILTKAKVVEVEESRIKVEPHQRSFTGWCAPVSLGEKWLHQPENVVRLVAPTYG